MTDPACCSLLPVEWDLPLEFRQRLGEAPGRQRAMEADGHLLLVLHAPPSLDSEHRDGRFVWRDAHGVWLPEGPQPEQTALDALLAEYDHRLDTLREQENEAPDARAYFEVMTQITPLVRATRNLYDALQEAHKKFREDRPLLVSRDRAYVLARSAELLAADAQHSLDFAVALRAEQQAASSHRMAASAHRLNVLAAFFFPVATIASIFSMSLSRPLQEYLEGHLQWPLAWMLGIGLVLGAGLAQAITRGGASNRDG